MKTPEEQKQRTMVAFDTIAARYDNLRFVQVCARRLIELAPLAVGSRVLDVATGTGQVALTAAQMVGSGGRAVGIDLSPEMLALARQKLNGNGPVEFRVGDAEHLEFPDELFDVVLCASSLFFVPDMHAALSEMRRVLAPGGCVGFSSFGPTFLQPLQKRWTDALARYGVETTVPPAFRLADSAICQTVLEEAGFAPVEVQSEQLGYYHPSGAAWWDELVASLDGLALRRLTPQQLDQIKAEYLAEVDALAGDQGVWVDVPAHFAFGWKKDLR